MNFPPQEKQPMSEVFYRCRKCGALLRKDEVIDRDGMHFCAACAIKERR